MRATGRPLGALDSAFLHIEGERTPMHMGLVGIFEGGPLLDERGRVRVADVRALVEARLAAMPDLRRCVRPPVLPGAPPVWLDDQDFAIAHHVRHATLRAPGTHDELARRCAALLARPLNRRHPLWELWVVDGLAGGRVAVVEKIHHAMADGLAGVALATVVLDVEPHPPEAGAPGRHNGSTRRRSGPPRWRPTPPPGTLDAARRDAGHLMGVAAGVGRSALGAARHPVRSGRRAAEVAGALATLATPRTVAPRLAVNAPVGRTRSVAFLSWDFDELARVAEHAGATANDVLLAAVAGGLARMLAGRGQEVVGRTVQVLVPVGLEAGAVDRLGNRVSALLVRLPLDVTDPGVLLGAVQRATGQAKARHQALAAPALLSLLEPVPQPLLARLAGLVHHQPFVNVVVTNVPGPPVPLYALGARMLEAFPIVPLAGNLDVGVAALSYNGRLHVGLLADSTTCPDVGVMARGITETLAALAGAAGSPRAAVG